MCIGQYPFPVVGYSGRNLDEYQYSRWDRIFFGCGNGPGSWNDQCVLYDHCYLLRHICRGVLDVADVVHLAGQGADGVRREVDAGGHGQVRP